MFKNFVAEIVLATPIITERLIGDSLLAGIAFKQHRDPERAIREIPINHVEGVPQISTMLPGYSPQRQTTHTRSRSFMRSLQTDTDMADMLDKMPPRSLMSGKSGPLINFQTTYTLRDLPRIYFIGCGDIDGVQKCFESTSFIGAQKSAGFGQVASVEVWEIETTNPWFGIVGVRNGRNVALRPIPLRLKLKISDNIDYILSNETWHNPYDRRYETAVVEACMTSPFTRNESFTERDFTKELSRIL